MSPRRSFVSVLVLLRGRRRPSRRKSPKTSKARKTIHSSDECGDGGAAAAAAVPLSLHQRSNSSRASVRTSVRRSPSVIITSNNPGDGGSNLPLMKLSSTRNDR